MLLCSDEAMERKFRRQHDSGRSKEKNVICTKPSKKNGTDYPVGLVDRLCISVTQQRLTLLLMCKILFDSTLNDAEKPIVKGSEATARTERLLWC